MKITIHRGTDQIGGCVTEYEHKGYRLFVDYGEQLPGAKKSGPLEIEGLTKGDLSKSALLITHYHSDHIGCIKELPEKLPIYIGKLGRAIQLTVSKRLSYIDEGQNIIREKLRAARCFNPGKHFFFGPFKIMPVTVDHSAFDAYAFVITADGVRVLHTGDFRMHGFRSKSIEEMIKKYVGRPHYIVCEGTNATQPEGTSLLTEDELQRLYEKAFSQKQGHIIYLSSTNIDRLFSLYHAAVRTSVPFLVDAYQKRIMDVITGCDSFWGKTKLYGYRKNAPKVLQRDGDDFKATDKFKKELSKRGYVLIARATSKFTRLIEQLPCEKVRYLSMWEGYVDEEKETYNESLAEALGKDYKYMHTGGHCDMNDMRNFFAMLQPKAIIPMHTESPERFEERFGNEWTVIRLHDGESLSLQGARPHRST